MASTSAAAATSAVRTAIRGAAVRRSSASSPWKTSLPTRITPTCVDTCSTSASRCEDTKTVIPSAGDLPDERADLAGALRVEAVGRLVQDDQVAGREQAAAIASRCFMPSE